jgi:GTP pyrophosphokinase
MACYAIALGLNEDNIVATILLHDILEDCNIKAEYLPVNDTVKDAVMHMTIMHMDTDISKIETKCRYFNELLESKEALICKALDRYNNLSDMPFALSADSIGKNVAETEVLLLPILKKAKEEFPEMADPLFVLRTNIRTLNDILKLHYSEEYEKWLKIYERKEL